MPPLVFVHGMWSRATVFAALVDELAAVGLVSHTPALPLHETPADSPPPAALGQLRLGDYVAAINAGLDADEPILLVGHSLGGLLAQLVAAGPARQQVKGLVLLATAPSAQTALRLLGRSTFTALPAMAAIARRRSWWRNPLPPDPRAMRDLVFNGVPAAEADAALADMVWESGAVLAQMAAPWLDSARGSRVDYARLALPVLVIAGGKDRIVPPAVARATARHLAAAGATVDYEEWPDVGHWLFHDAVRPRLAAAIARFAAALG